MILSSDTYVPALRWRRGEYQGLAHLADPVKDKVVPFITIPEPEFDFELWKPKKTVREHVGPFAIRYMNKWGVRIAWVGVHKNIVGETMEGGRSIFTCVFDELRELGGRAIPAVTLDVSDGCLLDVSIIAKRDGRGAAIVATLADVMKPAIDKNIRALAAALGLRLQEVDFFVDLGAPNFEPYEDFADALIIAFGGLGDLAAFRNFTLLSTAIPETFKDVARGIDEIPRHDWLFYKELVAKLPTGLRCPNYGDYTIVHPTFKPMDARKIKPAGKLIYTTRQCWRIRKGGAFRDDPKQMHDHCAGLVSEKSVFRGSGFSYGDDYIAKCAVRQASHSNQSRWKDVAINHHITHVSDELAMFGGPP